MPVDFIKQLDNGGTLGLWKVTETLEELEDSLGELLETKRYQSFHHHLRKIEWLGARALMKEMELSWELKYSEYGKPYYPEGPKISLTHSKDYIAIITHPKIEVGIDVQEMVPKVERIKFKYCNSFELDWAASIEDFTLIWSAKEAMFKVKERNVHFARDIMVFPPEDSSVKIVFGGVELYSGFVMNLEGYQGVFI